MPRCGIACVLIIALFAGSLRAVPDEALNEAFARYRDKWGDAEKQARNELARITLARQLYDAAQNAETPADRIVLCYQAYDWGRHDFPQGYRPASNALLLLQKTDRSHRLPALERLAELFKAAWDRDRNKYLGNGMGLAEVKMQLAQQRLLDLYERHDEQPLEKREFLNGLNECKRDYVEAATVGRRVIATAERYADRHPSAQARAALTSFVEKSKPTLDQIQKGQFEMNKLASDYAMRGDAALAEVEPAAPEVASAETTPKPTPKPDPTPKPQPDPEPEPEPEPPVTVEANPDPEPEVAVKPPSPRRRSRAFGEKVCAECHDAFVPPPGSADTVCYWCRNSLGFFRTDDQ